MDPGILALLIPVLALATGFVAVLKMPADAFRSKPKSVSAGSEARLLALEEEVGRLRDELASTHDRLDFTERLLTGREAAPLPKNE
jgi:hypothetical protein